MRSLLDGKHTLGEVPGIIPKFAGAAKPMVSSVPLNWETGWLIGATVGDGWVVYDSRRPTCVGFASGKQAEDVRVFWEQAIQKLAPDSKVSNRELPHEFEGTQCVSLRSNVYCSSLATWFSLYIGEKAAGKHLPSEFLRMPVEFRMGLFSGLVDTDGTCNWNVNNRFTLSITTISERLCGDICVLALSLGLIPSVTTYTHNDKPAYCIVFSVRTVQDATWLRLVCSYKREALERLWNEDKKDNGPSDIVPLPELAKKEIITLCRQMGATRSVNKNKAAASVYVVASRSVGYMTRTSVERLVGLLNEHSVSISAYLEKWLKLVSYTSVGWDFIESSAATGEYKTMYDITVPGPLNFAMADVS